MYGDNCTTSYTWQPLVYKIMDMESLERLKKCSLLAKIRRGKIGVSTHALTSNCLVCGSSDFCNCQYELFPQARLL